MDFRKINEGTFELSPEYDYFYEQYRIRLNDYIQPNLLLKITKINMNDISFRIINSELLEGSINHIIKLKKIKVQQNSIKIDKILDKITNEWENYPENFTYINHDCEKGYIYINKNLLNSDEYFCFPHIYFDNKRIIEHPVNYIATGYGANSYYSKEHFIKICEESKDWCKKSFKKLDLKATRKKFNFSKKLYLHFDYDKAYLYVGRYTDRKDKLKKITNDR